MHHLFSLDPRITRQPARNRAQIRLIALPKPATQRWFLVENHKQMHHHPYQQHIADQQKRVKENGLTANHQKARNIHWITHPLIGPLSGQEYRCIEGRWRPLADEGERPGAPEVEYYSYE